MEMPSWMPLWLLLLLAPSGGAARSCSYESLGCHKDDANRLLKFHLGGCPTDDAWADVSAPPAQATAPKCEPAKVALEYCAKACDKWRPWGTSAPFFVGLESGIDVPNARPGYAECACDVQFSASPPLDASACPAKCPGAAPGTADRCGGAPGTWSINIYRVECTSDWGGALLLTLLVCVIVYIGGGVGYNIKAKGVTPGLSALPHRELWINVAGLVVDGVVFTLARAKVVVAATGATKAGISDGRLESQVPLVQDRNDGNSEDEKQQKETPEAEAEAE